jgi:hypothetical protein
MRAKRTIAGLTAAAAFIGLTLVSTGTASAAPGTWVPYGNDNPIDGSPSKWVCAASRAVTSEVVAQVCAIRSNGGRGGAVQGAVIVRNNRDVGFSAYADVDVADAASNVQLGVWSCGSSGLAPNSWSVCFGKTFAWPVDSKVNSQGYAKGVWLGQSGNV